jgi:hypothetical protein
VHLRGGELDQPARVVSAFDDLHLRLVDAVLAERSTLHDDLRRPIDSR